MINYRFIDIPSNNQMMGRGDYMKRLLKKSFVIVSVFLLFFQNAYTVKHVQSQGEEETEYVIDFEIDEGQEDLSSLFDGIDRFTQYGLAKVYKGDGEDRLFGLINTKGELVLDVIYEYIEDYDDEYYEISLKENDLYGIGLASKRTGHIVIEPVYNWIGNIYEKEYFILDYQKELGGTLYRKLFHHSSEGPKELVYPSNFNLQDIEILNVDELKNGYMFIETKVLVELEGEGAGATLEGFNWLVTNEFEFIEIDNLYNILILDDLMYILTHKVIPGNTVLMNLYVENVINGEFSYTVLVEDSAYIQYKPLENAFDYSIETEYGWQIWQYDIKTKSHIPTKYEEYTFVLPNIHHLKFQQNCDYIEGEYRCELRGYELDDIDFENDIFAGLNLEMISFMGNDLYQITTLNNEKNIYKMVLGENKNYFMLFDENINAYFYIHRHYLTIQKDENVLTYVDIKDINETISLDHERVILKDKKDSYAQFFGDFLVIDTTDIVSRTIVDTIKQTIIFNEKEGVFTYLNCNSNLSTCSK